MGLLGISLIVGFAVLICFRPPQWLLSCLGPWLRPLSLNKPPTSPVFEKKRIKAARDTERSKEKDSTVAKKLEDGTQAVPGHDRAAIPPPPLPTISSPPDDAEVTPRAAATTLTDKVPTFSLDSPPAGTQTLQASTRSTSNMMAPPPRPPTLAPLSNPRPSPLPSRPQPRQPGSSTLAPPPTHTSIPTKPSRQVVLSPGHSPLDWARLSSSPTADLRNLPGGPAAPYLRVTPSMLKRQTGRRGKDAWTVLGGKVYNVTPYAPFHPGGGPELLRGAGRDGTRLFGEVHPWVNYEGMLQACLVGIMVSEEEGHEGAGKMDEMD